MAKKNSAAQDMAKKRWGKTTKEERSKVGQELAKKRWGKKRRQVPSTGGSVPTDIPK